MNTLKVYGSIAEMVADLDKINGRLESTSVNDPKWYGSTSYEEAKERILRGDDELAKKMRGSEKLSIEIPVTGTRRKMMTGVAGFAPHVPNFLAGVPNNMIWCREEKVSKRVLTVVYGCNTKSNETAEKIAKVSARILSCIMSLERKGYRIQLYASNVANGRDTAGFITKLKDGGQHIDLVKMAFPLMSASWNRRFGFRFREGLGWYDMGSSLEGSDLRRFLNEQHMKYDVALSYYDAKNITTVEELEKLFLKNVKKS